jgi:hypothetical protein
MLKALPKKKQYWVTIQSPLNHFALAGASGFRLAQVSQRGAKNYDYSQIGLTTPLISLGQFSKTGFCRDYKNNTR